MDNEQESTSGSKSWLWILLVILVLLLLGFVLWWFALRTPADTGTDTNTNTNAAADTASPAGVDNDGDGTVDDTTAANGTSGQTIELVAVASFASQPSGWYEHVWYKAADSGGEVTYNDEGVTFAAVKANSRSGIMVDVEQDVSGFSELNLHVDVAAHDQTLTGTGWNGREAPVAVAVAYTDADGVVHNLLGEDPSAAGQMFWRGFYYPDPTDSSVDTNGVKVKQGQYTSYDFDLITLDPKPVMIHYVGLEGAGWQSRSGSVSELSLTGVR
ncbi:MAG: hypothetical protein ABIG66_01285 [Candidatus Kerfeldbacteria bacterium]